MIIDDIIKKEFSKEKNIYNHKKPFENCNEIRLLISAPSGSGKTYSFIKDILPLLDFSKVNLITKNTSKPYLNKDNILTGGQPIYRVMIDYLKKIKKPYIICGKENYSIKNLFSQFRNKMKYPPKTLHIFDDFETKEEFDNISNYLGTVRQLKHSCVIITQSVYNLNSKGRSNLTHLMTLKGNNIGKSLQSMAEIVNKSKQNLQNIFDRYLTNLYDYILIPSYSDDIFTKEQINAFDKKEDILVENDKDLVGNGLRFTEFYETEDEPNFKDLIKEEINFNDLIKDDVDFSKLIE